MHTNTIQELILIQYESETDYEKINQFGKLKTILLNKNFEIIKIYQGDWLVQMNQTCILLIILRLMFMIGH